jgi:hypothetical protein
VTQKDLPIRYFLTSNSLQIINSIIVSHKEVGKLNNIIVSHKEVGKLNNIIVSQGIGKIAISHMELEK